MSHDNLSQKYFENHKILNNFTYDIGNISIIRYTLFNNLHLCFSLD